MQPPKLYIAVPVGEACECRKVVHDHFQFDGVVYRTIGASYRPKDITHGKPEAIDPEAIVQPVRLVQSDVLERVLAETYKAAKPATERVYAIRAIIEEAMPKCQ